MDQWKTFPVSEICSGASNQAGKIRSERKKALQIPPCLEAPYCTDIIQIACNSNSYKIAKLQALLVFGCKTHCLLAWVFVHCVRLFELHAKKVKCKAYLSLGATRPTCHLPLAWVFVFFVRLIELHAIQMRYLFMAYMVMT